MWFSRWWCRCYFISLLLGHESWEAWVPGALHCWLPDPIYISRLLGFLLIDITFHGLPGYVFLNIQSCWLITVDDDFSNIDRHCLLSRTIKVIAVVFLSFLPNYVIHQSHVDWGNSSLKEIVINCYGHFHSYVNNSIHSLGVISLTENGKRF